MSRASLRLVAFTTVVAAVGLTALAQEPPKGDAPEKAKAKLATAKAERAPIKTDVSFKGVFEAAEMVEVNLKPEGWGSFPVVKAIEAGAKVKEGDVLIEFDPEKIDKAIRDQESDQRIAELSLKMAEQDLPLAERANALDQAAAERQIKHAREDYEKWLNIDKKLQIDNVKFSLKSSENSLENQKEELKQLEKMYRSKDLTEETEEIVLKRQRFQVEAAEHFLRLAKNRHDQTLNVELPRREREMKDNLERAEIGWAKAQYVIPMGMEQKRLGLEKARYERTRARERFDNLKKDRALFTVKAPADGIVYYGKCVQGNWTGSATKLQKGGSVMGDEVFMTIVKPGRLFVRANVDEKDSRAVADGNAARITAPAFPDAKITGVLERVAPVPVGGNYEVKVKLNPTDVAVIPGMSAMVKVTTYEKKDAVTVPTAAVFTDEADEDKSYVYKVVDGKPEKKTVKVGKRTGGKAEILDGLDAGDEISLTKPEGGK
jgi:RND family efflux transporter MFP subunit